MRALRVAIIGCGRMGRVRAEACRLAGAEVVQFVDSDRAAATALAAGFPRCLVSESVETVDWTAVDAAIICTPPAVRAAPVSVLVDVGLPLLIEKPIGTSAAAVEPVAVRLREAGGLAAVGYMNRHRPSVQAVREALRDVEVFGVVGRWVAPRYRKPWWGEDTGGGALRDYATHLIDLCRYLVGEITEVVGLGARAADTGAFSLRFEHGAVGNVLFSSLAREKDIVLEFFFPGGSERLEGWELQRAVAVGRPSVDPFLLETRAFLAAAAGGPVGSLCTFDDALRTQLVVDAVADAIANGRAECAKESRA